MKNKRIFLALGIAAFALSVFQSCSSVGIPDGVTAVQNFEKDKYLGKWYEIARFDFRFERNLDNATAFYAVNSDGTIKVVNKGFNYKKQKFLEIHSPNISNEDKAKSYPTNLSKVKKEDFELISEHGKLVTEALAYAYDFNDSNENFH